MTTKDSTGGRLLTPYEVSRMFRVDPKTVTRWAAAGRLSSVRTPGGHNRFWENEVRALLESGTQAYENLTALEAFARWVVDLDDTDPNSAGARARRTVSLDDIIGRARQALRDVEEVE